MNILLAVITSVIAMIGSVIVCPLNQPKKRDDNPFAAKVASAVPDAHLTPGATNPNITQATIAQTICNPHWSTKSIRPSTRYTRKIKRMVMNQYRYTDGDPRDYELDHLISLELGGNPTDVRNLWPEPWTIDILGEDFGAHTKDKVENYLHKEVCAGDITLVEAQHEIATNWIAVYKHMEDSDAVHWRFELHDARLHK